MSTAFQGKIFNISILGTKDGVANNCIPCPGGYRSILGNKDCAICPNGTASKQGSTQCIPCEGNKFAAKVCIEFVLYLTRAAVRECIYYLNPWSVEACPFVTGLSLTG